MNKIFQLLAVILVACSVSCTSSFKSGWEYLVDNPLETDITIKVDNDEYTIPAKSTLTIKIPQGKHTLTYNSSSVSFVTKENSNKYLTIMNPTLSNYMLHAHVYVKANTSNKNVDEIYNSYSHEYQSEEGFVNLPMQVLNMLFIDRAHYHWAFGLDEEAKSKVGASQPGKKKVFQKLYREADYISEFGRDLPAGIIFPSNPKPLSEQPAYVFPTASLLCDCDVYNDKIKDYESQWNKIIANPSNIFQEVAQLGYDATTNVISEFSDIYKKCNTGSEDSAFEVAKDKLSEEMKYLSDTSTFIVK